MSAKTWRALLKGKHQLSLRLFLLLNTISACFSLASPIHQTMPFTVPVGLILLISASLLAWQLIDKQRLININYTSFTLGLLWAWHIIIKNDAIPNTDASFLIIALLTMLFIGAISFINNLQAFILHCLPATLTILWLDQGEHWLRVLYSVALPGVGITIQHIIQRRNDNFTQRLMNKLLEEKETLTDLSMIDPLTGLYNRRGFQSRLENVMAAGSGNHYVLLLDIDHFKAYNDNYGHSMGDQALIRVSAAIRDAVRSRDIVTRYGGEEFMVLLTNTDAENAMETAERIRLRVYDLRILHLFNEQVATNVTISIGIAPLLDDGIEEALEMADKALYRAKGQGRNSILTSDNLQAA